MSQRSLRYVKKESGGISIDPKLNSKNSTNIFRLLRIARDVKVKELADKLRVTPAYINAIESGTRIPSSRLIKDYSEALDVDEEVILKLGFEANKNKPFEKLLLTLLRFICE
jgi:transcriptional regulator with XRE-family HTH domain